MFVAVVVGLVLAAAPDEGSRKTAAELIDEGNALFERASKAALARFEAAYATIRARYFEFGEHARRARRQRRGCGLSKFLDQSRLDVSSPLMEQARRALEEIGPARLAARLRQAFGAEIYVDSELVGKMPLPLSSGHRRARGGGGDHRARSLIKKAVVGSGQRSGRDRLRRECSGGRCDRGVAGDPAPNRCVERRRCSVVVDRDRRRARGDWSQRRCRGRFGRRRSFHPTNSASAVFEEEAVRPARSARRVRGFGARCVHGRALQIRPTTLHLEVKSRGFLRIEAIRSLEVRMTIGGQEGGEGACGSSMSPASSTTISPPSAFNSTPRPPPGDDPCRRV